MKVNKIESTDPKGYGVQCISQEKSKVDLEAVLERYMPVKDVVIER